MGEGDRVGAILSADDKTVKFLGYGVYDGRFKPDVMCMGIPPEELPEGLKNPRITLDNGEIVWGCQCWWGDEEKVKSEIGDREIINVKMSDYND
jgi:hypothetical protein